MTSFPLFDDRSGRPLDDELAGWIDAGEPPIAFTAGTANVQARDFFAVAARASSRLGRRAVLLTGTPEQLPRDLPDGVRHVAYAPFSELFPRCAAVVHHGGVGTSAQALAAGVPQLLMPMSFDQPDNAVRLRRLGVARFVLPRRFTAERVAAELASLLASEPAHAACQRYRDLLAHQDPLASTCDHLEALTESPAR